MCMEFSRLEYWSGLPFASPGDLPNPGIEPRSPELQTDFLPSEPPGKPRKWAKDLKKHFPKDLQVEVTVWHRKLSSVLCDDLEGWDWGVREAQEEGSICIHKADPHCCTAETNMAL